MRKIIAARSHYYLFAFVVASFILAICNTMHVVTIYVWVRERERVQYESSHNCITIEKQTGWIELRNPTVARGENSTSFWTPHKISYIEHTTYFSDADGGWTGQFWLFPYFPPYLCARWMYWYVHFVHKIFSHWALVVVGCCFHLCDKQLQKWSKAITIALKYKLNDKTTRMHTQTNIKHEICVRALVFPFRFFVSFSCVCISSGIEFDIYTF